MAWIDNLYSEIGELREVIGVKLNALHTMKEDKSNKKNDLTSTDPTHYPNVPAVKAGITAAMEAVETDVLADVAALYIPLTQKGSPNGVATLDAGGKVPAAQLPSYVDDVIDLVNIVTANPTSGMIVGDKYYNSTTKKILTATSATAVTQSDPVSDAIYVNTSNNTTWRWSGTAMVQMNAGLALGETSSTAYRGDRGKIAYDHSQMTGNPHNTQIGDITGLQSGLDGKANIRLDNVPTDLSAAEKTTIRNKIGAGTGAGSVTSVAVAVPTGMSVTGSPITTSGTITLGYASGYSLPTTAKQTQWDTAYTNNHTHDNKAILDATTASFTVALKDKLDGLENYILPTATATVKGGVELFSDTVQTVAANAVSATASRTYGVQLNADGQMVVNVPWVDTNTTYTAGAGLTLTNTVFSLPVTVSGTGTYVQSVVQNTNGITVTLGTPPNSVYTLPQASSTVMGGTKLFSDTVQSVAANAVTTTASRTYGVQLNSAGQMVVNVPWANDNTTYAVMTIAELNTGTATTARSINASVLNSWGNGKYAQLSVLGDPSTAVPDWSGQLLAALNF